MACATCEVCGAVGNPDATMPRCERNGCPWTKRPGIAAVLDDYAKLRKRPVAFRVKDFADGWIIFQDEQAAHREADAMGGALVQGLYVRDGT